MSDRVLRLLDDLLGGVRRDLEREVAAVRQEAATLQSSELVDLDSFLTARRRTTATELDRHRRALRQAVDRAVDGFATRLVDGAVAAVPGPAEGRRARIEEIVQRELTQLDRSCRSEFAAAGRSADAIARATEAAFAKEFRKLDRPGRHGATTPAPVPAIDVAALGEAALKQVWALHDEHDSTENRMLGTGAAAGAVIGTMILPGIGTAIGAFLGAGSFLVGSTRREQALQAQVRTSTTTLATQVREQAGRHADTVAAACATAVASRVVTVRAHYAPLVSAVVERHHRHRRDVGDKQRALEADLAELERRGRRVDGQRRRIAATGRG